MEASLLVTVLPLAARVVLVEVDPSQPTMRALVFQEGLLPQDVLDALAILLRHV